LGFVIAGLLAPSGLAGAAPVELKAKVVWVRGERVYVASAESLAVEEGDVLRFRVGGKEIAAGTLIEARDEAMIVASLTSGSFRKQKKLEKVRIFAERPPLPAFTSLRIGCPSRTRSCLLFTCRNAKIGASLPTGVYRADTLGERSYRFVRDTTVVVASPWPDTLLVRAFDESADEEIALERGELDVAVFWPGELSTHLRTDSRWSGFTYGTRSSGFLAASGLESGGRNPNKALSALDLLNRTVFRGDLGPWTRGSPADGATDTSSVSVNPSNIYVDPSMPGASEIMRALHAYPRPGAGAEAGRAHLTYFPGAPSPGMKAVYLSAIRCPVVSGPKFRAKINALGAGVLADLLGCPGDVEETR